MFVFGLWTFSSPDDDNGRRRRHRLKREGDEGMGVSHPEGMFPLKLRSSIIHLLKHLSLPTGFVVALAHLHWHPFTIEKRAATIENEHVCSSSTQWLLICRLHHPFTRTTATRSRQHLRDGGRRHDDDSCRRSQCQRRVTNTICCHHHKWKMQRRGEYSSLSLPSFFFNTARSKEVPPRC